MSEIETKVRKLTQTSAKRSLIYYEIFIHRFFPFKDFPALVKLYREIDTIREFFEVTLSELDLLVNDKEYCGNYCTDFKDKYFDTYTIATYLLSNRNLNSSPSMTQQVVISVISQVTRPHNCSYKDRRSIIMEGWSIVGRVNPIGFPHIVFISSRPITLSRNTPI